MEVKEILDEKVITTDMKVRSKEEALTEMGKLLLKNEYITDTEEFMKDIYAREAEGQTGIGNYVAIPHGKSDSVQKLGVAIGINDQEIPWETLDGKGVKVVILFSVANDNEGAQNHLKILSLFARKLGNDEVIEKLLAAKTTGDVKKAFEI